MNTSIRRKLSLGCTTLATWLLVALAHAADSATALAEAEGLWAYRTLQGGGKGEHRPITGVILFKDGVFAQQSIFDGEPFAEQVAMAHAGPYGAGPKGIHMVAEQTISISPGKDKPLNFRRSTQHDIAVQRAGDDMTIVFDTGTVQTFKRLGPGEGTLHALDKGLLAFVDGYFVLVHGDENGVVSGFGRYRRSGSKYELEVIRWSEATASTAKNRRDFKLEATFDGTAFALADGRKFPVVPSGK
ncbi:MAG TPA: hypothetical protein VF193_10085 [Steroidobacter sp.]